MADTQSKTYEDILYRVEDGVAVVMLNRPDKLNAWRGEMDRDVRAAMRAASDDPAVKVIGMNGGPPRPPAPPLTPQMMAPIQAVAAKVFPGVPVTPMQETFGTDSSRLIAVGIPTYGFSALFRGDDAGNIHGLNEHISVQSVMQGREFMYRLIKAYAEQK